MRAIAMKKGLGMLLLGVYLVLSGLSTLIGFGFTGMPVLLGLLALLAGVLILAGR
jgi:hypothetical protein